MLDATRIAPDKLRPLQRREYDCLVGLGAFENERIELLRGLLVTMSPQKAPHSGTIERLTRVLVRSLGDRAAVRVQCPLAVSDDSEPEPDLAVVDYGDHDDEHPKTAFLVVEVADSSLDKDRSIKSGLYAEAGIPEYWIADLVAHVVEVHTAPQDGRYTRVAHVRPGEHIKLVAFPDILVPVDSLLRRRP